MNDKSVTDLAGIGEVLGRRLESKGFDKAYVVLGQVMATSALNQVYPEGVYPKQLTANAIFLSPSVATSIVYFHILMRVFSPERS